MQCCSHTFLGSSNQLLLEPCPKKKTIKKKIEVLSSRLAVIFKKMLINTCDMGIIVPSEKRLFCVEEAGTKLLKEKKY